MTEDDIGAFRAARDFLLAQREDYDTAYREFRWPELARFNWARDWFDGVLAVEHGDQTALWVVEEDGSEEKLSFAELSERSSQVAGWLRSHTVRRYDRVLVMLGNQVELWEALLAAMKLGAVIIPATTLLGPSDVADRVQRGNVTHVIARSEDAAKFAEVPGDWTGIAVGDPVPGWLRWDDAYASTDDSSEDGPTAAGDPLLLYFTSGTTAQPKLVEHSHVSYPVGHLSTMYWIGLRPGDVHLNISSPGWAKHAWSNVFAPWNAAATVLIVNQARFAAGPLLDAAVRCGATTFCAPPTVWRMLIQADLGAWQVPFRECVAAGEPLNPEVIEQVRTAWGITVRDGYGQTETTAQIGNPPGQPLKLGSMGRPLPGYRVVLADPLTGDLGGEGEICLDLAERPMGLMLGYREDEDRAAEAMRGGLYHTGDVATRDADGYITYVGRTDDVFKASDYRISPFELESVLLEHIAVAEAAVVPSPDPVRLAVPKAYVTLALGFEPTAETAFDILKFSRERLAPYKRVRRIEFAELPKTISGKIRRVELRGAETERAGQQAGRAPNEYWEEDFPELKA
ncbi:MAG TPA: AMP-binding protein [Micromonosporaceae bacterium]